MAKKRAKNIKKKKTITIKRKFPQIEYPGSLIMQNHGEENGKGFLYWDLKKRKSKFIQIENDFEYYTIDVIDGKMPTKLNITSKTPRIRVRFKDTKAADITKVLSIIRKKYTPAELTPVKMKSDVIIDTGNNNFITNIGDVRDVNYQNQLIIDYIANKNAIGQDLLDRIKDINADLNAKLTDADFIRNIRWEPKRFEFSNMFSYGENNVIDFTNMKGVYGLFGANSSGKSSLFDALTYCMFDKCARAYRGFDVLNNKADMFHCKFNFTINGKDFFIEKIGKKKFNKQIGKNTVKVDIEFWTIDDKGNEVSLNGEDRDGTNAVIRTYVGTYDDFTMTALSIQNRYLGFIDMKQSERKDLLVKFLDLEVFDFLYVKAADEIKDIIGALKEYKKKDFPSLLHEADNDYQKYNEEYKKYSKEKEQLTKQKDRLQESLLTWTKKLYDVDKNVIDISVLQRQQLDLDDKVQDLVNQIKVCKSDIAKCDDYLKNKDLLRYIKDNVTLEIQYTQYQQQLIDKKNSQTAIDLLKVEVGAKIEKLKHLEQHEYDPDCEYCKNNVFVKDAIKTREELEIDKVRSRTEVEKMDRISAKISDLGDIEGRYNKYTQTLSQVETVKAKRIKLENKMLGYENESIKLQNEQNIINDNRKKYEKNANNIKHNEKIQVKIDEINAHLSTVNSNLGIVERQVSHNYTQMKIAQNNKLKITEDIQRLEQLEIDSEAYQYYLEAVNTNGVPYELITQVIPNIEVEVNNILAQIVDFQLNLELDGKNINAKIIQDDENQWLLELGGGMEKFLSSVALRTALTNASNLPRPNFVVIDEGFSNVDADTMAQMPMLFNYLETQFDFVICISHNAFVKDMVNEIININKINDFSVVNYQ